MAYRFRESLLAYRAANHQLMLDRNRTQRLRRRTLVIAHYSNNTFKCACPGCETKEFKFLSIDHINNDGKSHRDTIGSGSGTVYRWLIKNNYPPGFQVLCHNCNMAKSAYGQCPHVDALQDAESHKDDFNPTKVA